MTRTSARSSRGGVTRKGPAPAVDQDQAPRRPAPRGSGWRGLTWRGITWRCATVALPALLAGLAPCSACQARPAQLTGLCPDCTAIIRQAVAALPVASGESLWLGPYAGVWRRLVQALKYRGARRLAPFLGALLASRVRSAGWTPQLVTHVPTTKQRSSQRGYDQAELLARSCASSLGLPHASVLTRVRATTKLAGQGRAAREAELANAFTARYLAGRRVLLLDDVLTTGATLQAAKAALLAAGASRVTTAVVAHTAARGEEAPAALAGDPAPGNQPVTGS